MNTERYHTCDRFFPMKKWYMFFLANRDIGDFFLSFRDKVYLIMFI